MAKGLRVDEIRKRSFPLTSTVALATMVFSPYALGAELRIVPEATVRTTYTDNVRLAPSGAEKGDFVTELAPGVSITADGPRLKLNLGYAMRFYNYANGTAGNRLQHDLDAGAKAELIEDLLFLDTTASVNQQNISPVGSQATSNISVTDNRTTVKTYLISPYLRHNFGSTATSELRYTHSKVSADTALATSQTDGISLSLNSGPAFRTLGWGISHSSQKIRLNDAQDADFSKSSLNLQYVVTPQFNLTASTGYEKYNYSTIIGDAAGPSYSGGFAWRPTERTSIAASAGRRLYGSAYSLDTSLRSRQSVWRVKYAEDITTTQSQLVLPTTISTSDFLNSLLLSRQPDAALRQQEVDDFIARTGLPPSLSQPVNYFTNQIFLQKSLQASVAITGAKNTVVLSVFDLLRDPQVVANNAEGFVGINQTATTNTRQRGANALWTWKVTPLTNVNFNASYARTKFRTTGAEQDLKLVSVSMSKRFQPKLSGIVEVRHARQSSDVTGAYNENAIAASVLMKF
ncbi:MAG: TIGR03016 family PEP-CTERM system-associated outer membrane protein [Pseudomonadota bacterium]